MGSNGGSDGIGMGSFCVRNVDEDCLNQTTELGDSESLTVIVGLMDVKFSIASVLSYLG